MPAALKQAFGLAELRLDLPEGYYGYLAGFIILATSIYAVLAGAQILSKEINKKTAETTFTLPVTRTRIIAMKMTAAVINCVILTAVTFIGTLAAFAAFDIGPDFISGVAVFMLFIFLLQLLFLLAGLLASVLTKRHKLTGTMVASITIGIYFLSFIYKLGENTEFLKYFIPFEYFPASDVIHGNSLELFGFIIVPVLIAAFFFTSFKLVVKKDI